MIGLVCFESFATSSVDNGRVYGSAVVSGSDGEACESFTSSDVTFFLAGKL